jgi:chromosome segregation ATPase
MDTMKAREEELITRVEDLDQQLGDQARELDRFRGLHGDYRKLLKEILNHKRRNSATSLESYIDSSVFLSGSSRTELTSDYGDHDTLDKELAQAEDYEDDEPDQNLLSLELAVLKAKIKEDSQRNIVDTVEHTRVVKDLKHELDEVRSAYEEETSELQNTLNELKSQLLNLSRQRSVSESNGSDNGTRDESEAEQSALAKVAALQQQISQHREDHKEVIQLLETAQTLATDHERKAIDLTRSLEVLRNKHSEQSSTVENLTAEITKLKSQHSEAIRQLEAAQINVTDAEKKAVELGLLLESMTSDRDAALRDVDDHKDRLQSLAKQHGSLVKEMESAHHKTVRNLKNDNSEYLTIIQHLKDQVSESETSISTYCLQITSFQQKLEAAGKDSDKAKRAKNALDRDLKELRNEVTVITRQRQETRDRLNEVTELLEQLQRDYDDLKSRKSMTRDTEAVFKEQSELIQALENRLAEFENRPGSSTGGHGRSGSFSGRWSGGNTGLTPPPTMPLPPLPGNLPTTPSSPVRSTFSSTMGRTTPTPSRIPRSASQDQLGRSASRDALRSPEPDSQMVKQLEEKDVKIANLEKQFQSERQLVQTLEEALSDTEKSMKQLKKQTNSLAAEKEMLHTKMLDVSHQLEIAKKEAAKSRDSIQQLDEARAQRAKVSSHILRRLIVGGSGEKTVGRSNGGDCPSEEIKIFVLLV